jgi:hypothetical protein
VIVANPSDPSLSYTIRYIGLPENAVPYRPRRRRAARRATAALVGAVALALAAAIASGAASEPAPVGPASLVPGEFRLGPGLGQPPGDVDRAT